MDVSIDTNQVKVLQDFFNDLSTIDQRKIFMSAYRKAVKPLVSAAKANAPNKTGQLRRSVGTIEKPDDVAIIVGAKLTGGNKKSGWYGNILEVGSYRVGERFRKRGKFAANRASTGVLKATHWFEEAWDATEKQVYDTIDQEWYTAIDNMIIRVNKKLK
jgi:hypothetical protein